jgi:ABC-type phosphate transport system ATPase subunit
MADETAVEIRRLSLDRNNKTILHDVSLAAQRAETVYILGPSGSGKSSLLRCVNRLLEPVSGTVYINGTDVTELDVINLRRRIGMILQSPALVPGSVADNVGYGPRLRGERLSSDQIAELLDMAGLEPAISSERADSLSGGQGQRVAIARALANQPQVLLLDEPTSALDPAATHHVEETIQHLRANLDLTVLWVSHDIAQAERAADRIYLLAGGRIVDEGAPTHLFREGSEHLAAAFAEGRLGSDGQLIQRVE